MAWAAESSAVAAGKQAKVEGTPVLGWLDRAAVPGATVVAGVVELDTVGMEVLVVEVEPGTDTVEAAPGLCRGMAVVEELGFGTVVGEAVAGTPDTGVAAVELGTGSAVEEVELEIDKAVVVEELGTAAVVEVGTALVAGLDTLLVEDKLALDWVGCTVVEQNQTSCTQAAAAMALVAAVCQKSFGKTADQVNHSTMGYTRWACTASSCSNLDMSLESAPLEKQSY